MAAMVQFCKSNPDGGNRDILGLRGPERQKYLLRYMVYMKNKKAGTLNIDNSSLRNNFAKQVTNGFSISESDLKISRSFISNQGGPPGRRRL